MSTYEWVLVEKGRAEGRVEGHVEGHVDGRLAAARDILTDLLMERFSPLSRPMSSRMAAISDEVELWRLARVPVKVSSLAEFHREIARAQGQQSSGSWSIPSARLA